MPVLQDNEQKCAETAQTSYKPIFNNTVEKGMSLFYLVII